LKAILFSDNAVAGEAAGLAMGLTLLDTTANATALEEMLQYAHETQHEKIIRGLAMGIALLMYGQEEKADVLIEQLKNDKDPILRYGGIYTVALAYAGTGDNKIIRHLLHVAVSDTSDDVRRAAVIALGFILFRNPSQVPRVVQLLSESFNPYVRQGATLAVGIACAATGMKEAIAILEPLTKDTVDYVRQGAFMALALVCMNQTDALCPQTIEAKKLFEKIISTKHEASMSKFGAIIAQGIIDAGGRNATIELQTHSGHSNMTAIVGLALFTQQWFWYPSTLFLSLAFTPTALIGVNKDLKVPKFEIISNAKPSLFAYPEMLKEETNAAPIKVTTAVLSTTAKAKARAKQKAKDGGDVDMKSDEMLSPTSVNSLASPMAIDEESIALPAPIKVEEPNFETLGNLSRLLPQQLKYIALKKGSRYVPITQKLKTGVTLLLDTKPGQPEELIDIKVPTVDSKDEETEPSPPEPFEYVE